MSRRQSIWARYKLRIRRKRLLWRAFRARHALKRMSRKTDRIHERDILLFATVRNEMQRLPYFLEHYRNIGIGHFLIVDNASDDGTAAYLAAQPDVSVWTADKSYKASRFGMDWLTCLQWRYGHGRWIVTVDADELLIYPDWEKRGLGELTDLLGAQGLRTMGALMLDLYPKGPIQDQKYLPGDDPLKTLEWFDAYGYWARRQPKLGNVWLQGGPRARVFFPDTPDRAPTLNKIPLVRWHRSYVYVNSTHIALPAGLNQTHVEKGRKKPSGVLLHTKFLPDAPQRARVEKQRGEHFAHAQRYADYYDALSANPDLWCAQSVRFEGAAQLISLGLMTRGGL